MNSQDKSYLNRNNNAIKENASGWVLTTSFGASVISGKNWMETDWWKVLAFCIYCVDVEHDIAREFSRPLAWAK